MQDGYRIAGLRNKANISQQDMATILDISLTAYQKYEVNESVITLEKINLISNIFDVSIDYLLGLTHNPKIKKISEEIDYKYLRFSLKYVRKRQRTNIADIAKHCHLSAATISKYERLAKNIPVKYLSDFAKKFNISIDYICGKSLKKEIL